MKEGTESMTLTFLKQQNDELFKEIQELRNKLIDTEIRLGEKLSGSSCCGAKED